MKLLANWERPNPPTPFPTRAGGARGKRESFRSLTKMGDREDVYLLEGLDNQQLHSHFPY